MIHGSAIIDENANLGKDIHIGPFTVIHSNVNIGDNTTIEGWCEIGKPSANAQDSSILEIGSNSIIRSHSTIYTGSVFGERLTTGQRVSVRENTIAGKNLQIGCLSDIQGQCQIGDYVRLHSNVHIGQHSTIGNFVWIFPYCILTNDPHPPSDYFLGVKIEDYVVVSTNSVILPGITIGEGALIGAKSLVSKEVPKDALVAGNPASFKGKASRIRLKFNREPAYPWRRHFYRGYPIEIVENWKAEFSS